MGEFLRVENLTTRFDTMSGRVTAVNDVGFSMEAATTLGIVGESGCGKSVTAMSIMRLIAAPRGHIDAGRVIFEGQDLLKLPDADMRAIRGNRISMIFQEPMTSLNPVLTIIDQIGEVLALHQGVSRRDMENRAIEALAKVRIPAPERVVRMYPHNLSGGMRQRVMIAMAMSCNPQLLIADEPTTALDVTVQFQIMELMRELQQSTNTGIMLITHDLGVIAEMCKKVIVMYAGRIVEEADVLSLFKDPRHPYTVGLMKSRPSLTSDQERLYSIPGIVPSPLNMPKGCAFHPRCPHATELCRERAPELVERDGHKTACHYAEGGEGA